VKTKTRARLSRAVASVQDQWYEAPWFVILVILITAFVGPGLLWALWRFLAGFLFSL